MDTADTPLGESSQPKPPSKLGTTTKVVVLTTVMFTFISYWRAAAVVIGDLGSTAYYIGGIAEQFIGKIAPYFILGVMLFSYAVRALYMESSPLFTRGGVYRVVKFALGDWFAKVSVSALVFDYVLTGPISSVSGGQYFTGLMNDSFHLAGINIVLPRSIFSMLLAVLITIYFWWENVKGIEESSDKALKIFKITSVMAVLVIVWGIVTLLLKKESFFSHLPPLELKLSNEAYGWLKDVDWVKSIGIFSIFIAFGHSLLALSGEETLGQVYREIEYPKLKNFKKTGLVIFIFSVIVTPGVCFLGIMLIPDNVRPQYIDNLIGGIAMFLHGPIWLRLIMQSFVVVVGVLILSGAVNTSIVGANSVLNRVAEDKVLTDWFRKPHKKFGTTYRILNLIAIMQISTIIFSWGDILLLGEAYAFGVIWSLTFKAIAMVILRYKDKRPREWRVPLNLDIKKIHLPFGLFIIAGALFIIAITNLFTKPIATISGIIFTLVFFIVFTISEYIVKRKIMIEHHLSKEEYEYEKHQKILEHFNLDPDSIVSPETLGCEKANRIIVAVRDPNNLLHLQKVIQETDTEDTDIIVMVARVFKDRQNILIRDDIEDDERILFSEVVNVAEKIGKPVIPVVIPTNNAFYAIVNVAKDLDAKEIILGLSGKYKGDVQIQQLALLWGTVQSDESKRLNIRIITQAMEYKAEL
ncbi:MAG TPA: APC family permease [Ignavibacteria bacterium]